MFFKKKQKPLPVINTEIYYNQLPSSIKAQLLALKSLDIFTRKHIEDVPLQALKICKQLGLDSEQTKYIMIASYLHDVGKIFVPPEILQKPGGFTDEEYEIMKSHSEKSYDICMQFDDLRQYAKDVRAHHESLDGSGYPDKLHGDQISFEARVLKVADVYSALKSKRQYKEEFTLVQIFEIMYKEVIENKMDATAVYGLLMAVIEEKMFELEHIKINLKEYQKQLDYNEHILTILEKFIKEKASTEDILLNKKMMSYLKKLNDFDISSISDANKLMVYINNNVITLTKNIKSYYTLKSDMKLLEDYAKKVMKKMDV